MRFLWYPLRKICDDFAVNLRWICARFATISLATFISASETNWTFYQLWSTFRVSASETQRRKICANLTQVIATNFNSVNHFWNLRRRLSIYRARIRWMRFLQLFSNLLQVLWFFPCVVPDGSGIVTTFQVLQVWLFFRLILVELSWPLASSSILSGLSNLWRFQSLRWLVFQRERQWISAWMFLLAIFQPRSNDNWNDVAARSYKNHRFKVER